MIRLGRKYEIAPLKEDALALLKKAFPVTVDDHSEYVWETRLAFPEGPLYDHDGKKLAAVLRLAYECSIRTILPLVFLQLLTLDLVSADLSQHSLCLTTLQSHLGYHILPTEWSRHPIRRAPSVHARS